MRVLVQRLRKLLLRLSGREIWPPSSNDPRIKGPQPHIVTRKQADAIRALCRRAESDSCPLDDSKDTSKE